MLTPTCIVPLVIITTEGAQGQKPDAGGEGGDSSLKINFSVGVNMYNEKVTCDDQIRLSAVGHGTNLILVSLPLQPAKGRSEHSHCTRSRSLEMQGASAWIDVVSMKEMQASVRVL